MNQSFIDFFSMEYLHDKNKMKKRNAYRLPDIPEYKDYTTKSEKYQIISVYKVGFCEKFYRYLRNKFFRNNIILYKKNKNTVLKIK